MNKFFQWFNQREQTEKIGLIGLVIAGIIYFILQINNQRKEILKLEKELRDVQNLQAFYFEKRRLQERLKKIKKGVSLKKLSYEDVYTLADKYQLTIIRVEKLRPRRFVVNPTENGIELSLRGSNPQGQGSGNINREMLIKPLSIKVIGSERNISKFLNELTKNRLVSIGGMYIGCSTVGDLERFKFPPLICSDENMYRNWLCSIPKHFYKLQLTLLLMQVGE